ncbi:MAG: alkaline phosphatase family protein, partial [Elusimicrobia bacterium]|nr:alkaline phosphatase family protein [Elusimicrobiota bacterium]
MSGSRAASCGWVFAAALLAALSLVPFLLPGAERFVPTRKPEPIAPGSRPQAPRLLFVMVDALGTAGAYSPGWMPRLQARLPKAAHGAALASFPTLTPNGLRALLSGRTGVPEPVFLGGLAAQAELDSVLARAGAAGRMVVAIGQQDWPALFTGHAARLELVPYTGRPDDDEVFRRALAAAQGAHGRWDILAVHLFDLDGIGHKHGVGSPEYRRKLLWLDERIAELAAAAGPNAAVLVTGDHGQSADGSHGGMDLEARQVPYILWGPRVRPMDLGSFPQRDSATTLSALLGLPPPILAEGWPRLDALQLSPQEKAAALLDLLEQRRRRWLAAKADWPWLKTDPTPRLEEARVRLGSGDFAGASAEAQAAAQAADQELAENSPGQWAGRLCWLLWLLVLAASFGAAGPAARPELRAAAAVLALVCAGLLACPLSAHRLWPLAASWGPAAAGALLLLSLAS